METVWIHSVSLIVQFAVLYNFHCTYATYVCTNVHDHMIL